MKIAGLIMVVVGVAAWTFNACFYAHTSASGMLQESLLFPLSRLAVVSGLVLLLLHVVYHALLRVFRHCDER
ncbi:DUF3955 domain-containing protein [Martelella mediterranea]|uniref:Uncharacterized protein DUF3955 n=1 Tax=Martelella mediterranea TaxID=293089 RepID=A0A4R3NVH4_9HYPH|nr:DUF3955 domain-containing protein [Martelella mediterranea]TCT41106.1 uncharacterized protein DUF3955 [Martelella mediterranea]